MVYRGSEMWGRFSLDYYCKSDGITNWAILLRAQIFSVVSLGWDGKFRRLLFSFAAACVFFLGCMERTHHMTPYLQKETTTRLNNLSHSLTLCSPSLNTSSFGVKRAHHMPPFSPVAAFLHMPHTWGTGYWVWIKDPRECWSLMMKRAIVGEVSGLWIVSWWSTEVTPQGYNCGSWSSLMAWWK